MITLVGAPPFILHPKALIELPTSSQTQSSLLKDCSKPWSPLSVADIEMRQILFSPWGEILFLFFSFNSKASPGTVIA